MAPPVATVQTLPFSLDGRTEPRRGSMIRKVLFGVLGAVLAMSIGAAGAYFTAQVKVPDSIIKAGTVTVSTEPTSAPLAIDALAPGGTSVRSLSVLNDGSLPVDVVVSAVKTAGITAFFEALTCRVSSNGQVLYDGPLSALRSAPVQLGAASRTEFRFEVGLPDTVGNDLAGDYAKVSLYVDAEQSH
jgi:hypothetical protein